MRRIRFSTASATAPTGAQLAGLLIGAGRIGALVRAEGRDAYGRPTYVLTIDRPTTLYAGSEGEAFALRVLRAEGFPAVPPTLRPDSLVARLLAVEAARALLAHLEAFPPAIREAIRYGAPIQAPPSLAATTADSAPTSTRSEVRP